jgi:hypothetical protein
MLALMVSVPLQNRLDYADKCFSTDRVAQESHRTRLRRPFLLIVTRLRGDENDWNPMVVAAEETL